MFNPAKPLNAAMLKSLVLSLGLLCFQPVARAIDVALLQQSTVDTNALTFADGDQTKFGNFPNGITHQQFPLQTYKGYQYAIYYDDERQVCVGRRKLPGGPWEVVRLTGYNITNNDTHNVAVLGICEKDGTIHLTFDHHVSNLHYRRSIIGVANDPEAFAWQPSLFGPATDTLGPLGVITQVTYPRFIPMPNGNLMLFYRFVTSGNGDGVIRVYDGTTSQWLTTHGKFIARDIGTYTFGGQTSQFRYGYMNGIGYGGNRLHASWVWRDRFAATSVTNQHDLCYAYSDDDGVTWNSSSGINIGVTGTATNVIHLDSPGLVVWPISQTNAPYNQNTQYAYPDGGAHVIVPRYRDGTTSTRYYHHYWRDSAGIWRGQNTGFVSGSRPEILGDDQRNLFMIYTSGTNLRILKGVPNGTFTNWTWSLIYNVNNPAAAGDGQVDPSRWRSERVLSVYIQERPSTILDYGSGTPFNGLPTTLRVTDFQVTQQAARPDPANGAMHVVTNSTVKWTAGLNAISNRVYFGTDSNAVATATTSSPEYKGVQTGTNYTPALPLAAGTTYYWRIDTVLTGSVVMPGVVWQFTTATAPVILNDYLTWDAGNTNNGAAIDPASGTWNKTAGNLVWNNGAVNTVWADGTNAVFAGADGSYTVTLTENVTATGLSFSNSGYTVSGDASARTLTLNGNLNVAPGKTATLGTNLTVTRGNTMLIGAGYNASVNSGTLGIASGATVGVTGGNLTIDGNGTVLNVTGVLAVTAGTGSLNLGSGVTNAQTDVTVNIKNGGQVRVDPSSATSSQNNLQVAFTASGADPDDVQGTINVESGGLLKIGATGDKQIRLGQYGAGFLTVAGTAQCSTLVLGNGGSAYGILNLNPGGVIETAQINNNKPNSLAYFNGGTVKSTGTNGSILMTESGSPGKFYVRDGGLMVDSGGVNVSITAPLLHSILGGDAAIDGGLTKQGAGTLTLTAANTYTGPTTVNAGTLVTQQPTLFTNSTVTVTNGAVLQLDFAGGATNIVAALVLGGVSQPNGVYNVSSDPAFLAGAGSLQVGTLIPSTPGNPQYVQLVGGDLIFSVTNNSGSYRVQGNTNLANPAGWVDLATNPAPFNFTNPVDAYPQQFYRTVTP